MYKIKIYAQIDDNVRVDVGLDAMVPVLDDLLPDVAVPHLGAEPPPLLRAQGLLALVRVEGHDRVQDGDVEGPDLYPRISRGFGYGCRLVGAVGTFRLGRRRWRDCD